MRHLLYEKLPPLVMFRSKRLNIITFLVNNLNTGFGLKGLVLLVGGLRLVVSISQGLLVFKLVPEIKAGLKRIDSNMFKDFFPIRNQASIYFYCWFF